MPYVQKRYTRAQTMALPRALHAHHFGVFAPCSRALQDAATTFINAGTQKQAFVETQAHRDDWLHRGDLLADVDYYHYARYFERIEQPRAGTAESFQKNHGRYFLFDSHYPLARTYVQVLRRSPKSVQNVGPQCQRSAVNNSEDNSAYKALFHSCVRCPGAGQCANPLIYQPLLYPRIDKIDRYLSTLLKIVSNIDTRSLRTCMEHEKLGDMQTSATRTRETRQSWTHRCDPRQHTVQGR